MEERSFNEFVEQVKSKNNIVSVIGRYVSLEQRGLNYWAKCPLHGEKTPSFCISEQKGTYVCYGCGEKGDVISFVQAMEACNFMEALTILAEKANIPIPKFSDSAKDDTVKRKKDRLTALMRDAAKHYYSNIAKPQARIAKEYLQKRELSSTTATNFGIGYSLGFNEVVDYLTELGYTNEEMFEAGVAEVKNNKYYDAQRGRLIIPILNNVNKVIAFGGRALEEGSNPQFPIAKYKNTKETLIFEKRKELFGVHTLKKVLQESKLDSVIIVEGYMDVISLYQAGIKNVVASMGTALTPEQVKTLKFYSKNIYLCYDGDKAGQAATYKGISVLSQADMNIKVMRLIEGLDPDDIVKKYGVSKFKELMNEALSPTEYKLRSIVKTFDINNPAEQGKFAVEAINILNELQTIVEREAYLPLLRNLSGLSIESLRKQLLSDALPAVNVLDNESIPVKTQIKQSAVEKRYYEAARRVLFYLFSGKDFADKDGNLLKYLNNESHKKIYNYAQMIRSEGKNLNIEILKNLENEEADAIFNLKPLDVEDEEKYCVDCLKTLKKDALMLLRQDLLSERKLETTEDGIKEIDLKIKNITEKLRG